VGGETIIACKSFIGRTEFEEAVAQWVNSSENWSEFKFFDFHELPQNPAEGQEKVPRRTKM